jgi:hypothetical protein
LLQGSAEHDQPSPEPFAFFVADEDAATEASALGEFALFNPAAGPASLTKMTLSLSESMGTKESLRGVGLGYV